MTRRTDATNLTDEAITATLAAYDLAVRENLSDEWDSVAAVAACDDGLYGAFGEVLDTLSDLGYVTETPESYRALEEAFRGYQRRLADEAGPDRIAAQRRREGRDAEATNLSAFLATPTVTWTCPRCGVVLPVGTSRHGQIGQPECTGSEAK